MTVNILIYFNLRIQLMLVDIHLDSKNTNSYISQIHKIAIKHFKGQFVLEIVLLKVSLIRQQLIV